MGCGTLCSPRYSHSKPLPEGLVMGKGHSFWSQMDLGLFPGFSIAYVILGKSIHLSLSPLQQNGDDDDG